MYHAGSIPISYSIYLEYTGAQITVEKALSITDCRETTRKTRCFFGSYGEPRLTR
jgi:hypothetical protein